MTRGSWIVANVLLMLTTVLAGWFAANAPEAARPSLNAYESVELTAEAPPLPPAPYRVAAADAAKALERRALFTPSANARSGGAAPRPPRGSEPMARTVLLDPTMPPERLANADEASVSDRFRASLSVQKPHHQQYFGGHLLSPESRDTDLDGYEPADGVAPDYASRPRINLRRPEAEGQPVAAADNPSAAGAADEAQSPEAAEAGDEGSDLATAPPDATAQDPAQGAGEAAIEEAATDPSDAAPPADSGEPEDMILLGVFQSRGAERALVRTATGGNVRVRPGDEIEGWRVSAIGEDNILLRRASKIRVLKLPE